MTRTLLRKCPSCSGYTLRERCPGCGSVTFMPVSARYSPGDRYGEYRRRLKKEMKGAV
ncbi:MAG: RNA-protein complex protein Nop10 [Methanobacteriota archaeon]|nr:MAG: RNA-protein complex protein Nop10 [Euryarchaeota archaeon]